MCECGTAGREWGELRDVWLWAGRGGEEAAAERESSTAEL